MNKIKSLFTPKKLVIWIAIIILFFTLPAINQPAMSETQAIVTMMCIDKEEDKIKSCRRNFFPTSSTCVANSFNADSRFRVLLLLKLLLMPLLMLLIMLLILLLLLSLFMLSLLSILSLLLLLLSCMLLLLLLELREALYKARRPS